MMSNDSDSETVEYSNEDLLAELTDDSFRAKLVPLDRPSDDYHTSEFIDPVVDVKPEDLHEMKQEPHDENDIGDSHCYVKQEPDEEYETESSCLQVSYAYTYSTHFCNTSIIICLCPEAPFYRFMAVSSECSPIFPSFP